MAVKGFVSETPGSYLQGIPKNLRAMPLLIALYTSSIMTCTDYVCTGLILKL